MYNQNKQNEQIYGRNDMVMLDGHNKIYGSLGMAEQYVFNTVEGNPAILSYPKAGKLKDVATEFEMQGWTEQAQYEGNQLFDETLFNDLDGYNVHHYPVYVGEGTFTCSSNLPLTSTSIITNIFFLAGNVSSGESSKNNGVYQGRSVTVNSVDGYVTVAARENTAENSNDPRNFDIMVNAGSTALPYEPYTGGQPSPSPDYPQEIVSAGKYDEDTQKWEYEITIANEQTDATKNQTVTLTADRPLTKWDRLEKRNGQWGWVYKSNTVTLDGSEDEKWAFNAYLTNKYVINLSDGIRGKNTFGYCNHFIFGNPYELDRIGIDVNAILWIAVNWASSDLTLWKNYLAQNPITVIYPTSKETFTPLSASEQEQMNALYTFRPTTVLGNDCDCNMRVTYKVTQVTA